MCGQEPFKRCFGGYVGWAVVWAEGHCRQRQALPRRAKNIGNPIPVLVLTPLGPPWGVWVRVWWLWHSCIIEWGFNTPTPRELPPNKSAEVQAKVTTSWGEVVVGLTLGLCLIPVIPCFPTSPLAGPDRSTPAPSPQSRRPLAAPTSRCGACRGRTPRTRAWAGGPCDPQRPPPIPPVAIACVAIATLSAAVCVCVPCYELRFCLQDSFVEVQPHNHAHPPIEVGTTGP